MISTPVQLLLNGVTLKIADLLLREVVEEDMIEKILSKEVKNRFLQIENSRKVGRELGLKNIEIEVEDDEITDICLNDRYYFILKLLYH